MPDIADLYDADIAQVGKVWRRLMDQFSRKPNTKANLQELARVAHEEFLKIGFVVNVVWENSLIVNPETMEAFPIEIEILGRVSGGSGLGEVVEGHELMDHERKRHEVLRSKERGEDYYGQKERARG